MLPMGHTVHASMQVSTAMDKFTKAQALCVLARALQAQGSTSHALSLYTASIEAFETPVAVYGYAQMLIAQVPCVCC
jgi:hypothetical protein